MALRQISFYASLLGEYISVAQTATQGHVLVYGAIEAHSMGPKGCIASNQTIAEDTGLSSGRVANIISELNAAHWIKVELNEKNQRIGITPMIYLHADVNPPSRVSEPPLHADVNIDNSKEKTVRETASAASQQKELLGNLNEVSGRSFRTLPSAAKALLKLFTVAEIRQSLEAMATDPWHRERINTLSSDYMLRVSTIERFFEVGITKQHAIRPAQKDTLIEKLREGNI